MLNILLVGTENDYSMLSNISKHIFIFLLKSVYNGYVYFEEGS